MGAGVPEVLRVLVALLEAYLPLIWLQRLPVESYRGGVEKRTVQFLVALVPFLLSKLVEVEDVRPEEEGAQIASRLLTTPLRLAGSIP